MAEINTIHGMMEESKLERKVDVFEDDNELTHAIEYHFEGELVRRDVHVQLKKNVICESIATQI